MPGRGETEAGTRAVVYCVIPAELARELHELLRRHFRAEPGVQVVVERRALERRVEQERRTTDLDKAQSERRRIRSASGRRIGDRRAHAMQVTPLPLPRRARRHAEQIAFVERIEPSSLHLEDLDTARLIARIQAGDEHAFGDLYLRYFDRVYAYMKVALKDRHEAEDLTQQVFLRLLQAIPRYERRAQPFRAWLFVVVRNVAISHLGKQERLAVTEADQLDRFREDSVSEEERLDVLSWISDPELMMLIERLPLAQRQVLVLRYMLDISTPEIARILERTPDSVRMLQSRSLAFLRARLTSLGRSPTDHRGRSRAIGWRRQQRVLRARRFSLIAPGPTR